MNYILTFAMALADSSTRRIVGVTGYRLYNTSIIVDPSSYEAQVIFCRIALLTSLENLLGIITACLPMLRPVLGKFWHALPKSSREKIATVTTAAGSKVARASPKLGLHFSHGPRSLIWFSTKSDDSQETQMTHRSGERMLSPEREKDEIQEVNNGKSHVRHDSDAESVVSDL